eukprot:CAMPEP_0116833318 /NCGR_PEP_ID=MMETSP0418-20121206/6370_1 /TAXON_ID=1158023 /ORGANISM="Astrosyne radiata, Strain 13vi08-1A" /LENGTH=241 /DNA_ID=CAMNT_0004462755 /DNA_START=88 /DNA_END=813 /DNA_ORIENTATION=+
MQLFPKNYKPGNYDVLCGRGTQPFIHIGNRRFRITIAMNLDKYLRLRTTVQRTARVGEILQSLREAGSHFLKRDTQTGLWFDIGDKAAHKKVGHALRDAEAERRRISLSKAFRNHHYNNNKNNNRKIPETEDHGRFLNLVDTLLTKRPEDDRSPKVVQVPQIQARIPKVQIQTPQNSPKVCSKSDSDSEVEVIEVRTPPRKLMDTCTQMRKRNFAVSCQRRPFLGRGPLKKRAPRAELVRM